MTKDNDLPQDEQDRQAILSRRTFLIEAALVNAGLAAACSPKASPNPPPKNTEPDASVKKPEPTVCLKEAPPPPDRDAGRTEPDVPPKPAPRPCLKVRPPEKKNEPMVCLDIAPDKENS